MSTAPLDFDSYQEFTDTTAIYPRDNALAELTYLALGLSGEAGEVAGKVKKIVRDQGSYLTLANKADIAKELGDVQWYLARLSAAVGRTLSSIAEDNVIKLRSRAQRGVLGGSGDNR